jgi:hypothetical protein
MFLLVLRELWTFRLKSGISLNNSKIKMKKFMHNSSYNDHIMFTLDFNLSEKAFKIGL